MAAASGHSRKKRIGIILAGSLGAVVSGLWRRSGQRVRAQARGKHVCSPRAVTNERPIRVWGKNWPHSTIRTGALPRPRAPASVPWGRGQPEEKLDRDPWLRRMFGGYAFAIDYRDRRGHAYMLTDQEQTERVRQKPQPGACLQCHASIIPTYLKAGGGDLMKGFELVSAMKYSDAHALLKKDGHAHPVSCVDCHDAESLQLRVTRPGFLRGIAALAASTEPTPHLPSIERWRSGDKSAAYDPNQDASRQEMRSFVCGQCHVEYHFAGEHKVVTYPWSKGLKVEQIEAHYDEQGWTDYKQAETGASILKAQHPESSSVAGHPCAQRVSCADCHMPTSE